MNETNVRLRHRYSASALASQGVSRQHQLDRVGARFDVAKEAYERTGEYKYYMMQKVIITEGLSGRFDQPPHTHGTHTNLVLDPPTLRLTRPY